MAPSMARTALSRLTQVQQERATNSIGPLPRVAAGAIPQQRLSGRLVVNVALLFSKVRAGAAEANADVSTSILTLYDMDLPFTRAALKEAPGR